VKIQAIELGCVQRSEGSIPIMVFGKVLFAALWGGLVEAKSCIAFGLGGMAETSDCASLSNMSSLPQTRSKGAGWVVEMDSGLALLDTDGQSGATLWFGGEDFTEIGLGDLTVPVGGAFLDGKVYIACFGSWPTPQGDSGIAVIDVATRRLESTHSMWQLGAMHLHNAYSFNFGGQKEIFVAVLGNPWSDPILAGRGLIRFDRSTKSFDLSPTTAELNVRSAKQQDDGSIFVVTQEPAGVATKIARYEERNGQLFIVAAATLPDRQYGGDGGADVVLGAKDSLWITDRQAWHAGLLYYYVYEAGVFHMVNVRDTGVVPRYTVALGNGDIVACNQNGGDLSVFKGLALQPTDTTIQEQRVLTVSGPAFFIETDRLDTLVGLI